MRSTAATHFFRSSAPPPESSLDDDAREPLARGADDGSLERRQALAHLALELRRDRELRDDQLDGGEEPGLEPGAGGHEVADVEARAGST